MKNFIIEDSKGEERIANYLDSHGYLYQKKQVFYIDGNHKSYPDFLVDAPKKMLDKHLIFSIEFDGQPNHFKPLDAFGGIASFVSAHKNDCEKDYNWELSKVPHLRIRYDQFDEIEDRLDDFFSHPEKYIVEHSRENWESYYDEWKDNFNSFLSKQESTPDERYIVQQLRETPKIYYFAEVKKNGRRAKETILML